MTPEQFNAIVTAQADQIQKLTDQHSAVLAQLQKPAPGTIVDTQGAPISHSGDGEFINASGCKPSQNVVKIESLNPLLPYHKIYLYLEANRTPTTTSDFYVEGHVTLWRNKKPVVFLPASIGQDLAGTLQGKTLLTAFANNLNGSNDAVMAALKSAVTTSVNPVLSPARAAGIIDMVTYSIDGTGNAAANSFSSFRAYAWILSSLYPF